MILPSSPHLRAIVYAIAGFTLWVFSDTLMKLAGQADVPPYQVVGLMGFFTCVYLVAWHAPQKKLSELWPKKPGQQLARSALALGCALVNTVALKHLPLTLFYIAVFTAPMVIAMLASKLLGEKLTLGEIIAILAGFTGVVIAVKPWGILHGGDWVGYVAACGSVLFFSFATLILRVTTQTETYTSLAFFTGFFEAAIGGGLMLWHSVPLTFSLFLVFALMGMFNLLGNLANFSALRHSSTATVEQYHYTQLIMGALLGYVIWHEVPTLSVVFGAAVITVAGLYIAAATHKASKHLAVVEA